MITLIGHGYIASHIANELYDRKMVFSHIHHTEKIPRITSVIINAAGYTGSPNVDSCEIHKQDCVNGNVLFPVQLEMNNPITPIIHISSGCIYNGYEKEYTEEDKPNFNFDNGSFYSGSKALEQELLLPFLQKKSYLLRIRMPFGDYHHPKNFITKLTAYEKLISMNNSLSYVPDVANVSIYFATHLPKSDNGIYNVCNPGYSNAKEIMSMLGIHKEYYTEEEFKKVTVAPRSNCILNTNKLEKLFPLPDVKQRLKEVTKKINEI